MNLQRKVELFAFAELLEIIEDYEFYSSFRVANCNNRIGLCVNQEAVALAVVIIQSHKPKPLVPTPSVLYCTCMYTIIKNCSIYFLNTFSLLDVKI